MNHTLASQAKLMGPELSSHDDADTIAQSRSLERLENVRVIKRQAPDTVSGAETEHYLCLTTRADAIDQAVSSCFFLRIDAPCSPEHGAVDDATYRDEVCDRPGQRLRQDQTETVATVAYACFRKITPHSVSINDAYRFVVDQNFQTNGKVRIR